MRFTTKLALILAAAASLSFAQQQTTSSKTRAGNSQNAVGNVLGDSPSAVLQVIKIKGTVSAVDLENRTVTVVPQKQEDGLKLQFSQPNGKEQIKTSKKAAKLIGKKKLKLEELKTGSKVRLQYYPTLGQVMELIVEQPAG